MRRSTQCPGTEFHHNGEGRSGPCEPEDVLVVHTQAARLDPGGESSRRSGIGTWSGVGWRGSNVPGCVGKVDNTIRGIIY